MKTYSLVIAVLLASSGCGSTDSQRKEKAREYRNEYNLEEVPTAAANYQIFEHEETKVYFISVSDEGAINLLIQYPHLGRLVPVFHPLESGDGSGIRHYGDVDLSRYDIPFTVCFLEADARSDTVKFIVKKNENSESQASKEP